MQCNYRERDIPGCFPSPGTKHRISGVPWHSPVAPTSGLQPSPVLPYLEIAVAVLSSLLER